MNFERVVRPLKFLGNSIEQRSIKESSYFRNKLELHVLNVFSLSIHAISQRLVNASTIVPAPPSASARIPHRPFTSLLKEQWNQQTAIVFEKLREWEEKAEEWGTKTLYGRGTREGRDR